MNWKQKGILFWGLIFITLIAVFTFGNNFYGDNKPEEITYSKFLEALTEKRIKDVTLKRDNVEGSYSDGKTFKAYIPYDQNLVEQIKGSKVDFRVVPPSQESVSFWQIILPWLPLLLLILLGVIAVKMVQPGNSRGFGFGKSRVKPFGEKSTNTYFSDVAGIDEAKGELEEIVEFLKNPKKFERLGGRIPRGVLLSGPPGSGKTLLARAIAGEAGVMFYSTSGSDFVEMFVGVGASRVRDMFEQAKKKSPCIIFIDEIDAVGRKRNHSAISGGHEEREQTLNQLLVEMDGFEQNKGIIIIGATNRPDILDSALLRPGRFDRRIEIAYPDTGGREKILGVHAKKIPMFKDVSLSTIAKGTSGFSGADLANLVNEAALIAARGNKFAVSMSNFEEARDKIIMGVARKSWILKDQEKNLVAFHEAGHAVLVYYTEGAKPLHKVTIMPRGQALGMVVQLPESDQLLISKKQALADIMISMGGRIAEEMFFGTDQITSGAANDIQMATRMARFMVTEWAIDIDEKGEAVFENFSSVDSAGYKYAYEFSEETKALNDERITRILSKCFDEAKKLLKKHKKKIELLAKALLEYETLSKEEVIELFERNKMPDRSKEAFVPHVPQRRLPRTLSMELC